ncbi:MAG: hypothetical protein V3U13_02165 [Gemmatimonadota bacterium]|jgi:tetratricopeptide (TPR) repeat protein
MTRRFEYTGLLAAVVLLVAAPAFALGSGLEAISVHTLTSDQQAHLDKGDVLFSRGDFGSARKEYAVAADLARGEGQVPVKALRRIANTQYYEGRYQSAGLTLLKLAKEAAEYGDIVTEAWAVADAAWVAGIAGDKIDVDRRVAQLERLLTSPYLPDDVREEIRTKRLGDYPNNPVALNNQP